MPSASTLYALDEFIESKNMSKRKVKAKLLIIANGFDLIIIIVATKLYESFKLILLSCIIGFDILNESC